MLSVKNVLKEKLVVIADDLTGANEIATIMVKGGKRSVVLNTPLEDDKIRDLLDNYGGVVFNLNSRNLTEEDAYTKVKDFLITSKEAAKRVIYKKIDSTVRGNLGKEICAVLDTGCVDIAVFAPAFPRMQRITIGGYHLVQGVPVGRSFYAERSVESYLPKLLKDQSNYQVGYVNLRTIELGQATICQKLKKEYGKGSKLVVCDCCSEDDLESIREAILSINLTVLPVGSAGLFEKFFEDKKRCLPSLIICGSLNKVTRSQLIRLMDERKCGYLELTPSLTLQKRGEDEIKRLLKEGEAILNQGKGLVIATPKQKACVVTSRMSRSLASAAKKFIENFRFAGMIVTGGDTAMALLESLGANTVEIIDELESLLPVGVIRDGEWEGMILVTKTGGFGTEGIFLKALDYLKRQKE